VPAVSSCSSEWNFAVAPDITNKAKQGRWYVPLISLFNTMSVVWTKRMQQSTTLVDKNYGQNMAPKMVIAVLLRQTLVKVDLGRGIARGGPSSTLTNTFKMLQKLA
jgi:hypothetical protein